MFNDFGKKAMLSELNEMHDYGYYPNYCVVNRTTMERCYVEDIEDVDAYLNDHDTDDCAILFLMFAVTA